MTPPDDPIASAAPVQLTKVEVEPMRIASVVLILPLIAGTVAAGQRGYYSGPVENCKQVTTIAVTIVAAPLNYFGMNAEIARQPSE